MKIGFVCGFPFLSPEKGVERRIHQTATVLSELGDLRPLIISAAVPKQRLDALQAGFGRVLWLSPSARGERGLVGKLRRLMDLKHVAGRDRALAPPDAAKAHAYLKECDIVWFHTLRIADTLGVYRWDSGVLDLDDLHSDKHRQLARLAPRLRSRLAEHWQALLWGRWERDALRRFRRVVVCSEADRTILPEPDRVAVMPNVLDHSGVAANERHPSPDRIGFLGTLEYYANVDAVEWLIRDILPELLTHRPSLRLRIVGRIPATVRLPAHPQVDLIGFVEDLDQEIATWSVSAVPIRVGSGTRIKILDSFCRRCPVVSTSLGCYGLGARQDEHLRIADHAPDFARACLDLIENPSLSARIGNTGFLHWQRNFTQDAIRATVAQIVTDAKDPLSRR